MLAKKYIFLIWFLCHTISSTLFLLKIYLQMFPLVKLYHFSLRGLYSRRKLSLSTQIVFVDKHFLLWEISEKTLFVIIVDNTEPYTVYLYSGPDPRCNTGYLCRLFSCGQRVLFWQVRTFKDPKPPVWPLSYPLTHQRGPFIVIMVLFYSIAGPQTPSWSQKITYDPRTSLLDP